jgi:hypothetical protein
MMRMLAGSLITALVLCGAGQAQQPPVPTPLRKPDQRQVNQNAQPTLGSSRSVLYQDNGVRKLLNLTDDQVDRLNATNSRIQQKYADELTRVNVLTTEQRAAELERLRSSQRGDFYKSVDNVLTPAQLERYRQLEYQLQGASAFSDPNIRTRLSLTNEQIRRIQELQGNRLSYEAFLRNPDGTLRTSSVDEYRAYRLPTNEALDAILSQEQRDRWRDLIGQPYDKFGPDVSAVFVR